MKISTHAFSNSSQLSNHRYGWWRTPYGMMTAYFWTYQPSSKDSLTEIGRSRKETIIAKIAICPKNVSGRAFRIVLDLSPFLNPPAQITYQTVRPNSSEIFSILKHGDLGNLMAALNNKTASLADRDEQGRSLLNVSQDLTFGRRGI
jgi:hypothetical protein